MANTKTRAEGLGIEYTLVYSLAQNVSFFSLLVFLSGARILATLAVLSPVIVILCIVATWQAIPSVPYSQ